MADLNRPHELSSQLPPMTLLLDDLLDITRGVLTLRMGMHELSNILENAIETARPFIDEKRHIFAVVTPAVPMRPKD